MTSMPLDRRPELRNDAAALADLIKVGAAQILVLAAGKPVIDSSADRMRTRIRWYPPDGLPRDIPSVEAVFLGFQDARPCFALDVAPELAERHGLGPAVDFRSLVTQGTVSDEEMRIIALARSLTYSASRSRHCGACAAPTREESAGWKHVCTQCGQTWFPRVDPVVIMLVNDGSRVLLAREPHFPPGLYSALAGFIEPGGRNRGCRPPRDSGGDRDSRLGHHNRRQPALADAAYSYDRLSCQGPGKCRTRHR